jgi:hypothetical protein
MTSTATLSTATDAAEAGVRAAALYAGSVQTRTSDPDAIACALAERAATGEAAARDAVRLCDQLQPGDLLRRVAVNDAAYWTAHAATLRREIAFWTQPRR